MSSIAVVFVLLHTASRRRRTHTSVHLWQLWASEWWAAGLLDCGPDGGQGVLPALWVCWCGWLHGIWAQRQWLSCSDGRSRCRCHLARQWRHWCRWLLPLRACTGQWYNAMCDQYICTYLPYHTYPYHAYIYIPYPCNTHTMYVSTSQMYYQCVHVCVHVCVSVCVWWYTTVAISNVYQL